MNIMIDIETLATTPDSVILTIGAQAFDPSSNEPWLEKEIFNPLNGEYIAPYMNMRLDVDSQFELGRVSSESTIKWWSEQTVEAQEEAFGEDRSPLVEGIQQFIDLCKVANNKRYLKIWSKGPTFDIVILEHVMRQLNLQVPWEYWNVRDARTIFGICSSLNTKKNGPISHRALDDCRLQIQLLREALQILNIKDLK